MRTTSEYGNRGAQAWRRHTGDWVLTVVGSRPANVVNVPAAGDRLTMLRGAAKLARVAIRVDLKHVDLGFKQCPLRILYDLFASRIPFTPSPLHLKRLLLQIVAARHFLRNHIRLWPHTTSYRGPPQLHPRSAHNYTTNRARIALQHIHNVGHPIVGFGHGHHTDRRRPGPGKPKH